MKTLIKILVAVVVVAIMGAVLWASEVHSKKVMAIDYCFNELADGSLYNYVCEE